MPTPEPKLTAIAEVRRAADMLFAAGKAFAEDEKFGSVTITVNFERGQVPTIRRILEDVTKSRG
jgi:hypothetical protein